MQFPSLSGCVCSPKAGFHTRWAWDTTGPQMRKKNWLINLHFICKAGKFALWTPIETCLSFAFLWDARQTGLQSLAFLQSWQHNTILTDENSKALEEDFLSKPASLMRKMFDLVFCPTFFFLLNADAVLRSRTHQCSTNLVVEVQAQQLQEKPADETYELAPTYAQSHITFF